MNWFHRNPLKATTIITYDDVFTGNFDFTKLASDLKKFRNRLLELLPDASNDPGPIHTSFVAYLSLMCGFFMDYKISERKIRYLFPFKWTHSLLERNPQIVKDAAFDMANMAVNVGLWYMKHASFLTSKRRPPQLHGACSTTHGVHSCDEYRRNLCCGVSMDDAKEIHTSLRKAAGIFQLIQRDLLPMLEPGLPNSDLDPKVLSAYYNQCIAEAQEVTIARSISLDHNSGLISALANETSQMFQSTEDQLKELNPNVVGQWVAYLQIKKNLYLSYAHCYAGKKCMGEDQFGEAIRALTEGEAFYKKAFSLCQAYSVAKGPTKPIRPHGHLFLLELSATMSSLMEQCQKENGFIYHQAVPGTPPELELKATFGLASPEPFKLPAPSPLWQAAFAKAEDLPELNERAINAAAEKELIHVVEAYGDGSEYSSGDHGCSLH